MALQLDPFQKIINVQWEEVGLHFLYSGADGMWGSSDGQTWKRAPSSEPAVSLAWVDDVWVGCGPGGCWRSDDGAESWMPITAPAFRDVVAMKPKGVGPDGKAKQGVFAGWLEDEEGTNHVVYTSHDLGKSWSAVLTIPTSFDDSGSESVIGLSGCGGALFVCTSYHSQIFHHGDGKIYSSTDGEGFSSMTVFGPGNVTLPDDEDQYPRNGFTANAVGYDPGSKTYIAIGDKEIRPQSGVQESYLVYSLSGSTTFPSGEGTTAESASQDTGVGEFISVAASAAGGNGKHVTGFYFFHNGPGGSFLGGDLKASFVPGQSDAVQSMGESAGGYIGSFCFKSDSEANTEGSTDEPGAGTFACVAFDSGNSGGAYVATSSGGFGQTHFGTGIDIGGAPQGAVAVGKLSFLGKTDAGL